MNLYTFEVFNGVSWAWEQYRVVAETLTDAQEELLTQTISGLCIDQKRGIELVEEFGLTKGLIWKRKGEF